MMSVRCPYWLNQLSLNSMTSHNVAFYWCWKKRVLNMPLCEPMLKVLTICSHIHSSIDAKRCNRSIVSGHRHEQGTEILFGTAHAVASLYTNSFMHDSPVSNKLFPHVSCFDLSVLISKWYSLQRCENNPCPGAFYSLFPWSVVLDLNERIQMFYSQSSSVLCVLCIVLKTQKGSLMYSSLKLKLL